MSDTLSIMVIKAVTFFGCSCGKEGDANFDAARATAREIAKSGRRVVNGGGPGTMLAATLGAKEGGGKSTAVYYHPELATSFEGKAAVNYADKQYEEANYIKRTRKLLELGDAYIIFNGGTGTISEFGMAWGIARLYFGHHKPLILYGEFWHELMDTIKKLMLVREDEYQVFTIVNSPQEVMAAVEKYEAIVSKNRAEHPVHKGEECHLLL